MTGTDTASGASGELVGKIDELAGQALDMRDDFQGAATAIIEFFLKIPGAIGTAERSIEEFMGHETRNGLQYEWR